MLIIDCHVHICPPWIRDHRQDFLQEEPEFAALYQDPRAKLISAPELIQAMQENQVQKSVVFGFPWRSPETSRLHNDYILQVALDYPGQLIPFCCLDPLQPQATKEVERTLDLGAQGLGEFAFYHRDFDQDLIRDLQPVLELAQQAAVPVLLHTNEPVGHKYPGKSPMSLAGLYSLLQSRPGLQWILAHLGAGLPFYAYLKKEAPAVLQNCWLDTAAMPFLYKPEVLPALAGAMGLDKILFGSDYPLLGPQRYYQEFALSGLDAGQQSRILGQNAANLLALT